MIEALILALALFPLTVVLSVVLPFLLRRVHALVSMCSPAVGSALHEQYEDMVTGQPRIAQLYESLYLLLWFPVSLCTEIMSHRRIPDRRKAGQQPRPLVPQFVTRSARTFFVRESPKEDRVDVAVLCVALAVGFALGAIWGLCIIAGLICLRDSRTIVLHFLGMGRRLGYRMATYHFLAETASIIAILAVCLGCFLLASLLWLLDSPWNWSAIPASILSVACTERIISALTWGAARLRSLVRA